VLLSQANKGTDRGQGPAAFKDFTLELERPLWGAKAGDFAAAELCSAHIET
jgi:hypothetical protein